MKENIKPQPLLSSGVRMNRINNGLIGISMPLLRYREVRVAIPWFFNDEDVDSLYAQICSFIEARYEKNDLREKEEKANSVISLPVYMFLTSINVKDIEDGFLGKRCFEEYSAFALEVDYGLVAYIGLPRAMSKGEMESIKRLLYCYRPMWSNKANNPEHV